MAKSTPGLPSESELLKALVKLSERAAKKQGKAVSTICQIHFGDNKIMADIISGKRSPSLWLVERLRKKFAELI